GDPAEAVRIGEAGLAIADRTGYVVWSLQWLLPTVGEAALTGRDFKKAAMHSARMRRDAGRLKHRLGLAYADACDGLIAWFGAAGLTGREIEIARMVAGRKSNKEIGGALQISSRTVSTHLSNIFLKLSVSSRGELADFVRQKGLPEG